MCNQINGSLPSKKTRTYFMGQSGSAVQDGDWFALFVELQLFMDLKGQIVFISKREKEREREIKEVNAGATARPLWANTPPYMWAKCAHKTTCAPLQARMKTCSASNPTMSDSSTLENVGRSSAEAQTQGRARLTASTYRSSLNDCTNNPVFHRAFDMPQWPGRDLK